MVPCFLAARRVLPVEVAGLIGVAVADALAAAHARGVIHRDVRPTNVFLPAQRPDVDRPAAKLMGFGVALQRGPSAATSVEPSGEVVGTREYMAPERSAGAAADEQTDVYALGVMLFEMLVGDVPRTAGEASTEAPSVTARRADVPRAVSDVVSRALAPARADRFVDARTLAASLSRALSGAPKSDAPPAQRRRFPRVPYVTPVRILRAEGTSVDGRSEDISEAGMLVVCPQSVTDGEEVEVRFTAPVAQNILKLKAVARWVTTARDGRGAVGLEFQGVSEDVRRSIAQYVELMTPRNA